MFQLFEDNSRITPRTYSIKGYKKRRCVSIKKILLYFTFILTALLVLGIAFLSANNLI